MRFYSLAKSIIVYGLCAIILYYVWTLFQIGSFLFYLFQLFFPLILALFFHFLLDPLICYFDNERIKRKYVVVYVYMSLTLLFLLFCYEIGPLCIKECMKWYELIQLNMNSLFQVMISFIKKYGMVDIMVKRINGLTQSLIYWVSNVLIGLGISFYLSFDDLHLIERLIVYLPFKHQAHCMKTLKELKRVTYQFMKSLILDFILFFFMCLIPFSFIDPSLCFIIALFLSLTNLIPYIGPYLGGIPIILYEYMQSGYATLIVIIILQYLESSYLQPFLFSKSIKLHPISLIIALTLFGDLFGIVGMIFSPLLLSYSLSLLQLIYRFHVLDKLRYFLLDEKHNSHHF